MSIDYDVKVGGIQRVHSEGPALCWMWTGVARQRIWVIHVSAGLPFWWRPSLGRKQYAGITEFRAGWLLFAVQVARRPLPRARS
jgi:hypothetical protein